MLTYARCKYWFVISLNAFLRAIMFFFPMPQNPVDAVALFSLYISILNVKSKYREFFLGLFVLFYSLFPSPFHFFHFIFFSFFRFRLSFLCIFLSFSCFLFFIRRFIFHFPSIPSFYPRFLFPFCLHRASVVGIATSYVLDDWEVGVRVPVGSRIFSSPLRPDRFWC
jgi:hypothetical protein